MSVDLQELRARAERCRIDEIEVWPPDLLKLIDAVEALRVIAEGTIPDRLIPAGTGVIDGETVSINYTEPVSARQFARAALAGVEAA